MFENIKQFWKAINADTIAPLSLDDTHKIIDEIDLTFKLFDERLKKMEENIVANPPQVPQTDVTPIEPAKVSQADVDQTDFTPVETVEPVPPIALSVEYEINLLKADVQNIKDVIMKHFTNISFG